MVHKETIILLLNREVRLTGKKFFLDICNTHLLCTKTVWELIVMDRF